MEFPSIKRISRRSCGTKQWILDNWLLLVTALVAAYGAVLATWNALPRPERISITRVWPENSTLPDRKLLIEVVNVGRCPVFVRTVGLYRSDKPEPKVFSWWQGSRAETALEPGEHRSYEHRLDSLRQFAEGALDQDLWVAAHSNRTELDRIDGAEVFRVIDKDRSSTN